MKHVLYYLLLFIFVFIIKFLRTWKTKEQTSFEVLKEIIDVAIDITIVASPFVINLLTNTSSDNYGIILFCTILAFLIVTFIEVKKDLLGKSLFVINSLYIISVISSTIYLINYLENSNKKLNKVLSYKIIIPYQDRTLINHVGYGKIESLNLFFSTTIKGSNKDSVINVAIDKFKNNRNLKPIYPYTKKKGKNFIKNEMNFNEFIEFDSTKIMSFPNY